MIDLLLSSTDRAEFWDQSKKFKIDFAYTVKSKSAELITFKVKGSVEFTNACFTNTVSGFSGLTFPLAQQIKFTPDLSTVNDAVSKLYGISGLCGPFETKSISCPTLSQAKTNVDQNKDVVIVLSWDR